MLLCLQHAPAITSEAFYAALGIRCAGYLSAALSVLVSSTALAACRNLGAALAEYGRRVLAENPNHPGSLGLAISEAVEIAAQRDDTKYALGSVLNHVLLHQTIIGLEAMEQMHMADAWPDVLVGCTGGGRDNSRPIPG